MVQIVPQQKDYVSMSIKKIPGFERTGEHVYHDMSMKVYMAQGDFIIIGQACDELGQVTLSDLYFRRKGDIIVPDIKEGQEPVEQSKMLYRIEKNIPLTRVYVFACIRIKN